MEPEDGLNGRMRCRPQVVAASEMAQLVSHDCFELRGCEIRIESRGQYEYGPEDSKQARFHRGFGNDDGQMLLNIEKTFRFAQSNYCRTFVGRGCSTDRAGHIQPVSARSRHEEKATGQPKRADDDWPREGFCPRTCVEGSTQGSENGGQV